MKNKDKTKTWTYEDEEAYEQYSRRYYDGTKRTKQTNKKANTYRSL